MNLKVDTEKDNFEYNLLDIPKHTFEDIENLLRELLKDNNSKSRIEVKMTIIRETNKINGICILKHIQLTNDNKDKGNLIKLYLMWCFFTNLLVSLKNDFIPSFNRMEELLKLNPDLEFINEWSKYIDVYDLNYEFKPHSTLNTKFYKILTIGTFNAEIMEKYLKKRILNGFECDIINSEYKHCIFCRNVLSCKNISKYCKLIDDHMINVIGGKPITKLQSTLKRLVLMFLIDEYPVNNHFKLDSEYITVIKIACEKIKNAVGLENFSTKILIADRNYKASVMRNVGMELCDTEWMSFSDDDDFRCSIEEFVDIVNKKIEENKNLILYSLPVCSASGGIIAFGMWRIVLKPAKTKLIYYNNPPFVMSGEDVMTWMAFEKIMKRCPELKKYIYLNRRLQDKGNIIPYLYMDHGGRYNDDNIRNDHEIAYRLILIKAGLLSDEHALYDKIKIDYDISTHIKELFDTIHSYDLVVSFRITTVENISETKSYYAFVTNRPTEEDNKNSTLPIITKPRKATIDHETGIVTYNGKNYTWEKWNDFITENYNTFVEKILPTLQSNIEKRQSITNVIDQFYNYYEGIDVKNDHPVVQLYGGKQEFIINIMLLMFSVILIVFIIACIVCYICSRYKNKSFIQNNRS